jgi:hypothetical protein
MDDVHGLHLQIGECLEQSHAADGTAVAAASIAQV